MTGPAVAVAVAVDEYVMVLGEAAEREMLAAKIYTFTAVPTLAVGAVTAADRPRRPSPSMPREPSTTDRKKVSRNTAATRRSAWTQATPT